MIRRAVITGMGIVSPVGDDVPSTWDAIVAGRSGVASITLFDTSQQNIKIGAEVKDWQPEKFMSAKEVRRHDRYQQFVWAAAQQAINSAGLQPQNGDLSRTAVIIGSSVGGIGSYYEQAVAMAKTNDPRKISPFGITMLMVNGGSNMVSIELGAMGASYTPISACATGGDCIGHAFDLIRLGRADVALAGCGEAPVLPIALAAFDRVGAASRYEGNPVEAVRPFERNRTGLVVGEGAGVVILEELEHAKARGVEILAELVGYGSTSDAFHVVAPHPDGLGASQAIQQALDDAQLNVTEIDYINAHGTATDLNDAMETKAVKHVFGEHAYNVPMSSTKSMTGHAMGATAAFEAVFSVLALRDQIIPPTINYDEADPDCDLDYVPNTARQAKINAVMSNSFGFGGHNVSLILKAFR